MEKSIDHLITGFIAAVIIITILTLAALYLPPAISHEQNHRRTAAMRTLNAR
ncbi:MAG: hypothetical protein HKM93_15990 [Desulfobacteraceae bacterium]|nr:hypothetical protein [Desulfobacteraceae bacterium]